MRQQALLQMASHHFVKEGLPVGRVEFLPIQWYFGLHNDKSGVDEYVFLVYEANLLFASWYHIAYIQSFSRSVFITGRHYFHYSDRIIPFNTPCSGNDKFCKHAKYSTELEKVMKTWKSTAHVFSHFTVPNGGVSSPSSKLTRKYSA